VVVAIVAVCRLSFACCAHPPRRHPFPTRRSSDLASHDHDGVYAPLTHSHPEYAPADHGHSEYAAVSHTHGIADVTGLRTELDDLAEAVEGLETGSGFLTQEEADGLYAASGHNHDALYASVTH